MSDWCTYPCTCPVPEGWSQEYGLLTNEELMTSVQDAVYEGEEDD